MEHFQNSSLLKASLTAPNAFAFAFIVFLVYYVRIWISENKAIPGFEVIGREPGEWTYEKARQRFAANPVAILEQGKKQTNDKIFQIFTHMGPQLIVPIRYMEEIRNNPHMDMKNMSKAVFFSNYEAFGPMGVGETSPIIGEMLNRKLTTSLASITAPVNEETNIAMERIWPHSKEWRSTPIVSSILDLTAQVSSRIFLGVPLCRDPEWNRIMKSWTVDLMTGVMAMRATPKSLRPLFYYILPQTRKLLSTLRAAKAILEPEIEKRRRVRNEAFARGETIPKRLDAIDWIYDTAATLKEEVDATGAQLTLSFVSTHTTTMATTHVLLDIIQNPELLPDLRQEIVAVMKEDQGWQKTSLFKLRLLDSVMKESQRMSVAGIFANLRNVHEEVKLSDGATIPKGVRIATPTLHMTDPDYWPDAQKFDGKRFLRLREHPDNINKFQFVTTSPEHLGFGHGKHSCPGRFFASNEIKVMICHLIMKYDWQFKDGKRPQKFTMFGETTLDPTAELLYKSRVPEVAF